MYEGIESLNLTRQPAWKTAFAVVGLLLSAALMVVLLLIMLWRGEPDAPVWVQSVGNGTYIALWAFEVALVSGSAWLYRKRRQIIRI